MDEPTFADADSEAWANRRGRADGLCDLTGELRLAVNDQPVGTLRVENGSVSIHSEGGDATALVTVDTQSTLLGVLGGRVHPFVAYLQGRLRAEGDRALAMRVLFGLRAGSPWSNLGGASKK